MHTPAVLANPPRDALVIGALVIRLPCIAPGHVLFLTRRSAGLLQPFTLTRSTSEGVGDCRTINGSAWESCINFAALLALAWGFADNLRT
jgi:hypothetical protein